MDSGILKSHDAKHHTSYHPKEAQSRCCKIFFQSKDSHVVVPALTAYTYGYNINSSLASSTKLVIKRQTNAYETDDLELGEQPCGWSSLPKRDNVQEIFSKHLWPVNI